MERLNEYLKITPNQYPYKKKHTGPLLILGSGKTVWDDFDRAGRGSGAQIMCLNDVGMYLPVKFEHWYSNDHFSLPRWFAARRPRYKKYLDDKIELHTCGAGPPAIHKWQVPGHGTSALPATHIGLLMGYEQIILCGVPLDDGPHWFDPPWTQTKSTREAPEIIEDGKPTIAYWAEAARVWKGRVTSMSGRTKELLNPSA